MITISIKTAQSQSKLKKLKSNPNKMHTHNKILVVGAGLAGSTVARVLADSGYHVDVIDKRNHVAGNCFDYTDRYGIRIHKYGPHIFHTNNTKVFQFLSRFTEWIDYTHHIVCLLEDGTYVPFPVNTITLQHVPADQVYEVFYRRYTQKMWGTKDVDQSVIKRMEIRDTDDSRCFKDQKHQVLPINGYTRLVENMLDHENIKVLLTTDYTKNMEEEYTHCFTSQAIDTYYQSCYGDLPYRSIKFNHLTLPLERLTKHTQVNFTNDSSFTRYVEWKNFPNHGINPGFTSITFERPCCYTENNFERYYPIKNDTNIELYKKYRSIPNDKVTFIGRCGQYVYLDMDMAVASSLAVAKHYLGQV